MTLPPVVPILMYHQIAEPEETASRLAVRPADFRAQLCYLKNAGFTTITASALASALAHDIRRLPPQSIVLTFDDGYADFCTTALPVLREHAFTATVFITTAWIGNCGSALGRMLSWSQVSEVAANAMEIGAHSHTHPQLDHLPDKTLHAELRTSKYVLEDYLCSPVTGLAYPFGYSSTRVRRAVEASGYRYACAVKNTVSAKPELFALPRLTVKRSTTLRAFGSIVQGRHLLLAFARERALTKGWALVRHASAGLAVPGSDA